MSPRLFTLYTEQVIRDAGLQDYGMSSGGRQIADLRYADDTARLISGSKNSSEALKRLDDAGKQKGLSMNIKKTKWMSIGGKEDTVSLDGEQIEEVQEYKYLGSIKCGNGDCSKDIRVRIGMAKKRVLELTNIWKDHGVHKVVKMRLVKALVWPVLTYGAEAWTLKAADIRSLEAAEMWTYRRVLRISWRDRRTNESVLRELGIHRQLLNIIKKRKLCFFGHLCRADGLAKVVVCGIHPGRRRRGRPRRRYGDDIRAWTGMDLGTAIRCTADRSVWREIVDAAVDRGNGRPS